MAAMWHSRIHRLLEIATLPSEARNDNSKSSNKTLTCFIQTGDIDFIIL